MTDTFHYPADLFDLIVQTIPLLNRSKKSVLLFFKGAGIDEKIYSDISSQLLKDRESINKYEITTKILERINENTDKYLGERRELLKRITEFEAFSSCWEKDQYKAKGLVSEIRNIINVKDSFTRMKQELERETNKHKEQNEIKINKIKAKNEELEEIKKSLYSLFSSTNPHKRGKDLEVVLNEYFKHFDILIKEDFKRVGDNKEGVLEQVDGIIEINNDLYFVEMKWRKDPIRNSDIFEHLGRIYHRTNANGIFISASGYTSSGIEAAKEAIIGNNALLVLFNLEEFVKLIERKMDLKKYIKDKIKSAIINKNPFIKLIE